MIASEIIQSVSRDLDDQYPGDEFTRWTEAELLEYLNDGEGVIVFFKPQAYQSDIVFKLSAGSRQTLPSNVLEYIRPIMNMGPTGIHEGDSIYPIEGGVMDNAVPGWRSSSKSAQTVHIVFDRVDRKSFDVYPPSNGLGYIKIVCSLLPTRLTSTAQDINLSDEYVQPLKAFMLFRAHYQDSKSSGQSLQRSMESWQFFLELLGRKDIVEAKTPPKVSV